MGYSNYKKLEQVTKKFKLDAEFIGLFDTFSIVEPSNWLLETLKKAKLVPLRNEKVKSERIVSPILMELAQKYQENVTLFSGEELLVDSDKDLSGECDFFFILAPRKPYLESPIISLVEAKDEDMDYGIAQCAAQLYGAKLFNEMEGKNFPVLYGCATDGVEWKFLRFENNVFYIDNQVYTDLKEILGIFDYIIQSYLE
ncbi:MAG: hypothetical protein EAZ44_09505 [Cytophagia bacterium]|nr:MAG: hypothetical protein EAZ44_09505 [Cytophagia bacterium]TAG46552.1 MAG: hypothetical protein EAZ31_00290 [Cytophagia bacterium]